MGAQCHKIGRSRVTFFDSRICFAEVPEGLGGVLFGCYCGWGMGVFVQVVFGRKVFVVGEMIDVRFFEEAAGALFL